MDLGRYTQGLKGGLGILSSVIAIFVASKQEPVQKLIRQQVGPSYSCADRRILNATELAVCNSWQLSRLDLLLSNAYYDACGNLGKPISNEELTWLKTTRNACGNNETCLAKVYTDRIAELSGKAQTFCG